MARLNERGHQIAEGGRVLWLCSPGMNEPAGERLSRVLSPVTQMSPRRRLRRVSHTLRQKPMALLNLVSRDQLSSRRSLIGFSSRTKSSISQPRSPPALGMVTPVMYEGSQEQDAACSAG
jgi:hypothetical protein